MTERSHSHDSSLREKVIEHLFVGDVLRCLWCRGGREIEVLRTEVDRSGYDLVVEANGIMRHIQLKSSYRGAKTGNVAIHIDLGRKPSGCVIWIWFDERTMELGPFLWFGGHPGEELPPLGDKVARHSKGDSTGRKAERPNTRVLAKGKFLKIGTIEDLVEMLFGPC